MIDLRDLECLVELARFRHFARAAEACGLSQPAFSVRIRNLERRLDTLVVKRGNRFQQLTPEGEAVVAHARAILGGVEQLEQEAGTGRSGFSGSLLIGVIPTALAKAARAAMWFNRRHPDVRIRITTASSLAIQQGIEDGHFDAGLTYSEGTSRDLLLVEDLYDEEYVLIAPAAFLPRAGDAVTWSRAAELPLTLLDPSMLNRRIVDGIFEKIGANPRIVFESNGFSAAIMLARAGVAAAVVPSILVDMLGSHEGTVVRALEDPVVRKPISLVMSRQSGNRPVVAALRETIHDKLQ